MNCRSHEIDFGTCSIKNFILLNDEELKEILSWRNNKSIRCWMFNSKPIEWTEHIRFVGGLAHDDDNFYWRATLSGTGLGVMYLKNMGRNREAAELGIYVNPFYAGGGAGKRIMDALVKLGFEYFRLRSLTLKVFEDNHKAVRFYSGFGFTATGIETVRRDVDSKQKNVIMMQKENMPIHHG